jgi:hypothetical protein
MTPEQDTALALKTPMTDTERDHFVRQLRDLERRLRRWKLACLVLLGLLVLPVVLGGLVGVWWAPRLERERARRQAEQVFYQGQIERAASEMQAKAVAEEALQQAERQGAEEEARRRAQPGLREGKD